MNSVHSYEDILYLPHPDPGSHPRMPLQDRAAQFMPFAALTGFSEILDEIARPTDHKAQLSDQEKQLINRKLDSLLQKIDQEPEAEITRFVKDPRKEGGKYVTERTRIRNIDIFRKKLISIDGQEISFDDIFHIES